jgi:GNAT superfamily N-acetyltransferase
MYQHLIGGGTIRKLSIDEAPLYGAHLLRLDPDGRRSRFGGAVADAYIRGYAEWSTLGDAVIHGFFVDGELRGAAELRLFAARAAEVALSIEKDWQSHGVGTALFDCTLGAALNRGIKWLHLTCLPGNLRMQQLARKFHADLKFEFGSVAGVLEPSGSNLAPRDAA